MPQYHYVWKGPGPDDYAFVEVPDNASSKNNDVNVPKKTISNLSSPFSDLASNKDDAFSDLASNKDDAYGSYDAATGKYATGRRGLNEEEYKKLRSDLFASEYAPKQDLSQFDALLSKLEASKLKQLGESNRARRDDI